MTRWSHRVEYVATRAAVASLRVFGWRGAGAVGGLLGRLAYAPFGIRRAVVDTQLRASFPDWTDERLRTVARACYDSIGRSFVEAAVIAGASREHVLSTFESVTGWEHVERATSPGPHGEPVRGCMIVSGHLGNWELGAAYCAARGIGVDAVVRGIANPLMDAYVTRTRQALGVGVVHDRDAVRHTPKAMRAGRMVGFLCDQDGAGLASTFVPFFGRLAKTPRGPAVFALRLDCEVIFAAVTRRPSGRYHFHFEPLVIERTGDRDRDIDAFVARYTARLEDAIREAPEQYFWHHRRWKRRPPEETESAS
jgi:Kdo2-lipid IVA lauroyltransferase/acyltransferase